MVRIEAEVKQLLKDAGFFFPVSNTARKKFPEIEAPTCVYISVIALRPLDKNDEEHYPKGDDLLDNMYDLQFRETDSLEFVHSGYKIAKLKTFKDILSDVPGYYKHAKSLATFNKTKSNGAGVL